MGGVEGGAGVVDWGGSVRKQFFFEKKNQKTFIFQGLGGWLGVTCERRLSDKSFLFLFFQKRKPSLASAFCPHYCCLNALDVSIAVPVRVIWAAGAAERRTEAMWQRDPPSGADSLSQPTRL
jgi:hypothetical protein